jgi:hypothetical protein
VFFDCMRDDALEEIQHIVGGGSLSFPNLRPSAPTTYCGPPNRQRKRYQASAARARMILQAIRPFVRLRGEVIDRMLARDGMPAGASCSR